MVRAIWRAFEEASSEERETMVAWRWDLLSRDDEGHGEFWGIPGLTRSEVVEEYSNILAKTLGVEPLTLEDVAEALGGLGWMSVVARKAHGAEGVGTHTDIMVVTARRQRGT